MFRQEFRLGTLGRDRQRRCDRGTGSVLLWARLASAPAERDDFSFPVVGFWHIAFERWKVAPALLGEKGLIPTYWTELPPEPDMSMSDGC